MLVPQPTNWSIKRLFVGSRGILFENRTTASPNLVVRSPRSDGGSGRPFRDGVSLTRGPASADSTYLTPPGVRCFGIWSLEFPWILDFGFWNFISLWLTHPIASQTRLRSIHYPPSPSSSLRRRLCRGPCVPFASAPARRGW